jgi:hypothetical protein
LQPPSPNPLLSRFTSFNSKLSRADFEAALRNSGGQAFGDILVEIVANQEEFWFVYHSSLIWYFEHDKRLFDLLAPVEEKYGYDLSVRLSEGNLSFTKVDDDELIAKFKLISQ